MSEFSPLRDPVFLLTWQVHLAVVILFALLGIWAGMTRRPWYIAPTLFLALLWLFIPLEAPEPVVVLLLSVPVLAIACRIARRWLEKPQEEPSKSSPSRLRFSLGDLLWLMVLVGLVTALLLQVRQMPWRGPWQHLLLFAACLLSLSMSVLIATSPRAWKRPLLTAAILFALLLAVWFAFVRLRDTYWLLLIDWDVMPLPTGSRHEIGLAYLLTVAEFLLFTALGTKALSLTPGSPPSRRTTIFKGAAIALLSAVSVGLGIVYLHMLDRPKPPDEQWPAINEREAFWTLLERHRQLNRQYGTFDELPASKGPAAALAVGEILVDLDGLLERGNISQFDSRFDRPDHKTNLTSLHYARSLARALIAQAQADWQAGKRSEALYYHFRCLRLGQALQRRATLSDSLLGVGIEDMSLHRLAKIRAELTLEENRQVTVFLTELAATREPLELLLSRERFFVDRAGGWRGRLVTVASQLMRIETFPQKVVRTFRLRDAKLSLLRADLAIRRYRLIHGEWPDNLAALMPDLLPSLPMDPFSAKPLLYRVSEDRFVLYCTSTDGVDNGGRFGSKWDYREAGYDLDLESWLREYD